MSAKSGIGVVGDKGVHPVTPNGTIVITVLDESGEILFITPDKIGFKGKTLYSYQQLNGDYVLSDVPAGKPIIMLKTNDGKIVAVEQGLKTLCSGRRIFDKTTFEIHEGENTIRGEPLYFLKTDSEITWTTLSNPPETGEIQGAITDEKTIRPFDLSNRQVPEGWKPVQLFKEEGTEVYGLTDGNLSNMTEVQHVEDSKRAKITSDNWVKSDLAIVNPHETVVDSEKEISVAKIEKR